MYIYVYICVCVYIYIYIYISYISSDENVLTQAASVYQEALK